MPERELRDLNSCEPRAKPLWIRLLFGLVLEDDRAGLAFGFCFEPNLTVLHFYSVLDCVAAGLLTYLR